MEKNGNVENRNGIVKERRRRMLVQKTEMELLIKVRRMKVQKTEWNCERKKDGSLENSNRSVSQKGIAFQETGRIIFLREREMADQETG